MASRTRARLNNLNDRAREVGRPIIETLTLDDLDALRHFYKHTCLKCGKSPAISPDHVKPLSLGGANTVENLQLLCDEDNKAKGDEEIDYRQGKVLTREFVQDFVNSKNQPDKRNKHDWDEIEFDYIHSEAEVSLRELAHKYNVSLSHIGLVASREDWKAKRQNYRNKIGTEAELAAIREQIDIRLEIDRTTLDFLKLWRRQHNTISNQDMIKILELGARAAGLDLNKQTLTVKDWRDAAGEKADDIQDFATQQAESYFNIDDDSERGTGWTD